MPLQATSGAASYDAFGGGAAVEPNYIESVFSTYLYTGNGSTQTITNGIDLAGKGGLIWFKRRSAATDNTLYDTARGVNFSLSSNLTSGNINKTGDFSSFNSDGFTIGTPTVSNDIQSNTATFASWTFRKQPKFFDVVTWTGNATSRTISHSLGSVPACIIVKCTSEANQWVVYHRSLSTPTSSYVKLNSTDAVVTGNTFIWDNTAPTSTVFSVGASGFTNNTGQTYVAYLFAHNAGGFGLTGTDNVISCGSFTGLATVDLGYEPQWILYKTSGSANSGWLMVDNMRGFTAAGSEDPYLEANSAAAEAGGNDLLTITSTGFKNNLFASDTFIYIAIRRGPMKVPTTGTSVYQADIGDANVPSFVSGFPVDMAIYTGTTADDKKTGSRLTGTDRLYTNRTIASNSVASLVWSYMNGWNTADNTGLISWMFKRAPSFMDVVCYSGTGSATTFSHNLQAVPELMIVKGRDFDVYWYVYSATLGATKAVYLNATDASGTSSTWWNNTTPTSSVFTLGTGATNSSGQKFVAYLFATCAGVSKVGSYTGNGSTQTIDCGFGAGGARFVLIKRTDSTSGWYTYDTVRGMTTLTNPYLFLNDTAAETATLGSVTTVSTGFALNSTILAAINVNAGNYIFLAIA